MRPFKVQTEYSSLVELIASIVYGEKYYTSLGAKNARKDQR